MQPSCGSHSRRFQAPTNSGTKRRPWRVASMHRHPIRNQLKIHGDQVLIHSNEPTSGLGQQLQFADVIPQ